jgi:hypothetical protein
VALLGINGYFLYRHYHHADKKALR